MTNQPLPEQFQSLEPWVADWAKPTRQERYDARLSKTIDELNDFYDAIAPHAESAIDYLNGFELDDLPAAETRLLQLLYSLVIVSYPVNVFKQPRIPDTGAAFFETVTEPAV
ncbi:hypothetical protein A5653_25045 [Mycobacterium colombiense]|uniref:hypothetical protein n=1 Tax=Mycobacterium colombiense TaxID=339268 RepID=UPI0007F02B2E|nr:hypothetical protein [Mycobacterium colombiense]OBK63207.1 hypothetical protein A5653_25045 [Mycobacterium colombiense]